MIKRDPNIVRIIPIQTKYWKCPIEECQSCEASQAVKIEYRDRKPQFEDHKRPQCHNHKALMVACPKDEFQARSTVH